MVYAPVVFFGPGAKPPELRGKGGAGDLPCRGARGTLSGRQCEGPPCLSLFPKEVGWFALGEPGKMEE